MEMPFNEVQCFSHCKVRRQSRTGPRCSSSVCGLSVSLNVSVFQVMLKLAIGVCLLSGSKA